MKKIIAFLIPVLFLGGCSRDVQPVKTERASDESKEDVVKALACQTININDLEIKLVGV